MIIAIPHWGTDERYFLLLEAWVEQYLSSGSTTPFVVVTDHQTRFTRYPTLALDVSGYRPLMRPEFNMDRKGALMCEAMKYFGGGVLFCDADALVMRKIEPHIDHFRHATIAMCRDSSSRQTKLPWDDGEFREMNAGVMWLAAGDKEFITDEYRRAWMQIAVANPIEPLIEQLAWSCVWNRLRGVRLQDAMQWVERSWGRNPEAVIVHHHGVKKFETLSSVQPNRLSAVACNGEQQPQRA